MRLVTISVSTTGSRVVPLDVHLGEGVAIGVVPISGTPSPTIQHSFQNPLEAGWTEAGAYWFNHSTLVSVATTSDGYYSQIPHAVRVINTTPGDYIVYIQQNGLTA